MEKKLTLFTYTYIVLKSLVQKKYFNSSLSGGLHTVSIKHACKILHFKNNLYVTFDAMRRNTSIKFKPFLALNPIKNVSFYKNIF